MTSKLLRQIYEHIYKSSPMDFGEFTALMYLNEDGMNNIQRLWQKQHNEDGFPPRELNEADYYMLLNKRGILTNMQLDLLLVDLYKKEDE